MSIAEKLEIIAENEQKVYESGVDKGTVDMELKFWEMFTANGEREIYARAFNECDFSGYTFAKPVVPTKYIQQIFYNYRGSEYPENIDLSQIDTSLAAGSSYLQGFFQYGSKIKIVPDMGLPALNKLDGTYANMSRLVTIEKIRVHENTILSNSFASTPNLENVTFEGVIGQNVSFSGSPKLTHDSLVHIIGRLKDYSADTSGTTYTLTIGSTNIAKLTTIELETIRAKGWQYK